MKKTRKKSVTVIILMTLILCAGLIVLLLRGCEYKKEPKPKAKATPVVKDGNAQAERGSGQSETPLRVGTGKFERKYNPFLAENEADIQVVELTQLMLFDTDRTGNLVKNGIDGEICEYNGKKDTYYGIADMKIQSVSGAAVYDISIRNDLTFSDGEGVDIDDVIFSMYAFCDKAYDGIYDLKDVKIKGLKNYHKGKADYIEGIEKTGDYSLRIHVNKYSYSDALRFRIPVCPLHYYGDETKYSYENHMFGFKRGDLSTLRSNRFSPMGGGAYRFVKYESGIAYFMSNDLYYKGCPESAYLYLQDMTVMVGEQAAGGDVLAKEVAGDTVDLVAGSLGKDALKVIMETNTNQQLSGKTLTTEFVNTGKYNCIRINPEKVKVDTPMTEKSKNLRKGILAILRAARKSGTENFENTCAITDYPVSSDSWLSPVQNDEWEDEAEEGRDYALKCFEEAGYVIKDGKLDETQNVGKEVEFEIWTNGEAQDVCFLTISEAKKELEEIGFRLNIRTRTETGVKNIASEQMGTYTEILGASPAFVNILNNDETISSQIKDSLSITVDEAENTVSDDEYRKKISDILKKYEDMAVELPVNQNKSVILYSTERVDKKTMPENLTMFYTWIREVEKIKM